jgi:TonB family protein
MKPARRFPRILATLVFAVALSQCCFLALGQTPNNSSSGETSASAKPAVPVPDEKGIYKVGGAVSAPKLIHSVDPKYTEEAKRDKFEGVCYVDLIVDPQGMPRDIHVAKAVGKGLDENAVKAIQQYRFEPAKLEGKPVPVKITIKMSSRIW